jgi:hypothetical protein
MVIRWPSTDEWRDLVARSRFGGLRLLIIYGLVHFIISVLSIALGWKSEVEEAVTTAYQLGPIIGVVLFIVASPWFGLVVVLLGLGYAICVPSTQHPSSRLAAMIAVWSAFGVSLCALFALSLLIVAMRLSQMSIPTTSPGGSGFLQLSTINIPTRFSTFAVGKQFGFNINWTNPVAARIFNAHEYSGVFVRNASEHNGSAS